MLSEECAKCHEFHVSFFIVKKDKKEKKVCSLCKEQLEKEGWVVVRIGLDLRRLKREREMAKRRKLEQ
jgi:hypothetical protein